MVKLGGFLPFENLLPPIKSVNSLVNLFGEELQNKSPPKSRKDAQKLIGNAELDILGKEN